MRTFKNLAIAVALLCSLVMCATALPSSKPDDVAIKEVFSDPVIDKICHDVDVGYLEDWQNYPYEVDSVVTYVVASSDYPLLQRVYFNEGKFIQFTRYLHIRNLIYRDYYTAFREYWRQEDFIKHKMRVMEKERVSYGLEDLFKHAMWQYFNSFLHECGEDGISFETFEPMLIECIPPGGVDVVQLEQGPEWIGLETLIYSGFILLVVGLIAGIITGLSMKPQKK